MYELISLASLTICFPIIFYYYQDEIENVINEFKVI